MTEIVSPVAAIRAILLADSDIEAIVVDRVFDEIDEDEAKLMPRAAIVLQPSGGPSSPGGGFQQYGRQRIDVHCYGETLYESYMLSLTVYAVLKHLPRQVAAGALVYAATVQSKSSTARNPLNQWPVTYSSWLVTYAEIPAA